MTLKISLGPYFAEELVLPFVLASGGSLNAVEPSQHAMTASDIVKRFTGGGSSWSFSPAESIC